jgi:hypothetical protein
VKGSAPPPKTKKAERGSCKTMDECEAVGVARSDELFADSGDGATVLSTSEVLYSNLVSITRGRTRGVCVFTCRGLCFVSPLSFADARAIGTKTLSLGLAQRSRVGLK